MAKMKIITITKTRIFLILCDKFKSSIFKKRIILSKSYKLLAFDSANKKLFYSLNQFKTIIILYKEKYFIHHV